MCQKWNAHHDYDSKFEYDHVLLYKLAFLVFALTANFYVKPKELSG